MPNKETSTLIAQTGSTAIAAPDQDGCNATGILVFISITAITGTSPTYTVILEGKSPISNQYYTILQSAALTTAGLTVLKVYPGLTAVANVSANDVLPPTFRVRSVTGGTAPSVTANVGCSLIF